MARDNSVGQLPFPILGAGLGYRRELAAAIMASHAAIDFVEIVTDQFLNDRAQLRELAELAEVFVVIPHGIGLSVGSPALDGDYLRDIKRVSDAVDAPYYSEHLAMTRAPGVDIGHLSPLWFTEGVLRHMVDNVRRVQDVLGIPLLLENITYPFDLPAADMTQAEFLTRLVETTGCGILLDVTNLRINAANHAFDPVDFLCGIPLESIGQLHLAGGYRHDNSWIDGHCESVDEGTWHLLEAVAQMTPLKAAIIERDSNFPSDFSDLLAQVARAREILARSREARAVQAA